MCLYPVLTGGRRVRGTELVVEATVGRIRRDVRVIRRSSVSPGDLRERGVLGVNNAHAQGFNLFIKQLTFRLIIEINVYIVIPFTLKFE